MLSIKLSENGGRAPEAVPYMPAGESWVVATVNGVPGRRRVVATREGCERLQRDLAEHLRASGAREKARPLLMFDHNVKGGAAAVPVGFEWDDERGILLRVEWTQAGRAAVEGGDYGYISPSFLLKRESGEILGLPGGVEVGSLVNDPAFERTECIAAGREDEPEAVCVERLEAANPCGCNQYGHGWKGDCTAGGGDDGAGGDDEDLKEVEAFEKLSPKDKKERLKEWQAGARKAADAWRKYRKGAYSKAYVAVHGMDKEASEAEYKALYDAENELRRLENEANAELQKVRSRMRKVYERKGMKGGEIEAYLKHYPERVKAASALPPQGEGADGGEMVQNAGVPGEVAGAETEKKRKYMEEIAKLLGLPADADSAAICAKISALKSQGANDKKRIEEVEAEKEEHKKALHEHKEKAADAFVERQKKEGKIAPKDEERLAAARAMYLNDAAGAEVIFAGMRRVDGVRETSGADSADKVQGGKAVRDFELLTLEELLAAEG